MGRLSAITPLLCGVGLLLSCALVSAASFYVSPVRVELSARSATAAMTVRNEGERPIVVQVQPVAWSQRNGNDETAPTREVIATPAVFTLPAQGSQIVRVGLRRATAADKEQTYRLFLQEVPAPPKPGEQGVTMALRLSIPIFVAPAKPKGPALTWRAERQADGDILVEAVNSGDTHAQITRLLLSPSKTEKAIAETAVMSYVLAGQTRQWKLKPEAMSGQRLYLQADTDAGPAAAELDLPSR
jgi:fimbrial chaperone protein